MSQNKLSNFILDNAHMIVALCGGIIGLLIGIFVGMGMTHEYVVQKLEKQQDTTHECRCERDKGYNVYNIGGKDLIDEDSDGIPQTMMLDCATEPTHRDDD